MAGGANKRCRVDNRLVEIKKIRGKVVQVTLLAPNNFCLRENYHETAKFFQEFREKSAGMLHSPNIEFRSIERISPEAALALASELDSIRITTGSRLRARHLDKWNPEVRRLLFEMGLFRLLNVANGPEAEQSSGIKFIRFRSHHQVRGDHAREVQDEIEAVVGPFLKRKILARGLAEAMTNVHQHAYPDDYDYGHPIAKHWWIGGSVDPSERRLTVIVFDQGVGIPYTLPQKGRDGWLKGILGALGLKDSDGSRIRAAMELGRSSTNEPNRGKGLSDIKRFALLHDRAELRILSGCGEYLYSSDREESRNHAIPLKGTMIYWSATI